MWRVWALCAVWGGATLLAAGEPLVVSPLQKNAKAILDRQYEIAIEVTPHAGDAWTRLARRTTGDANHWEEIAELNQLGANLTPEHRVRIPLALLKPSLQVETIRALFPKDGPTREGWKHVVTGSNGIEGEPLWKIAEWFTGDGVNYASIRPTAEGSRLSTRPGDVVLIPGALLSPAFRSVVGIRVPEPGPRNPDRGPRTPDPVESSHVDVAVASVLEPPSRQAEKSADVGHGRAVPNPVAQPFTSSAVPGDQKLEGSGYRTHAVRPYVSSPLALEYGGGPEAPYALYRLKKGEALYSSVAIRFTGRVYAKDVSTVVERLTAFNGIGDVSRIPADYAVRIPLDLLLPEYLPPGDPRRIDRETAERASAKLAHRVEAHNLQGVHVILDAGHGGRDAGTIHGGLWESTYVYDVMCRLKRLIEKKSRAVVTVTTWSESAGYRIPERNALPKWNDHVVMTTPVYRMEDAVVGVNLRWYLANSVFLKAAEKTAPEKVVFISLHADSLHPSLRGAMVYIPGEQYVRGSYGKSDEVYLARSEVREHPTVTQGETEALRAEGLSKELAESVLSVFKSKELRVHPFNPIRESVIRDEREWVPAILRYNKVPTRLLIEICNLGNENDRKLVQTQRYRQEVAGAIFKGLVGFFETRGEAVPTEAARTAAK